MPWIFILVAVVRLGALASQFWVAFRIRRVLISRHPQVWLDLCNRWDWDPMLQRFAWKRAGRDFGDTELTGWLDIQRICQLVTAAGFVATIAIVITTVPVRGPTRGGWGPAEVGSR